MNKIEIKGNGNVVIQSHSGSGDNIGGNKITINTNNMKDQIRAFIAANQLAKAIILLHRISDERQDGNGNDIFLLESRLNGLERQERLGTIPFDNANVERARITAAILSLAGLSHTPTPSATPTHTQPKNWEQTLLEVEAKYTRQNPAIAREASQLLVLFRQYHDRKRVSRIFDINGTRLEEHEAELEKFLNKVNGQVMESRENFVEKVAELLSATVPDWSSIEEAFTLCVGRGMSSNHMENVIQKRPNDDEAKLRIVEAIESFLSSWA